jgi:hypoxanthine phosphoribosyltransferase
VPPIRTSAGDTRGVLDVDWPLFGELSRALALRVARGFDPEVVIGIATAGVVPGAVVAAILQCEFHSILVSRRFGARDTRQTPTVMGAVPPGVRDRRVLVVDETCDSGETMRLALAAVVNGGAADVRTAVGFRTGSYEPDFAAMDTESTIILPWDREVLVDGALVLKPEYAEALERARNL